MPECADEVPGLEVWSIKGESGSMMNLPVASMNWDLEQLASNAVSARSYADVMDVWCETVERRCDWAGRKECWK